MRRLIPVIVLAAISAMASAQEPAGKLYNVGPGDAQRPKRVAATPADFAHPHNLVLSPDGRHLIVTDMSNDVVKVLDPETLKTLAVIGAGKLAGPHDTDFDSRGRILVADTGNDRVVVYEFTGIKDGQALARQVATLTDKIDWPEGVAGAADGEIYVTNVGDNSLVRIRDGKVIGRVEGGGGKSFARPHDVEVDERAGHVIVADSGNNRLVIFDRDLSVVKILTGAPYHFYEPKYLATTPAGFLWIADEYNSQIKILDPAHKPVGFIGSGEKGNKPGQLNWPEGVFVRGADVWISDTYNNRILKYRLPGS